MKKNNNRPNNNSKRRRPKTQFKEGMIYFEGKVIETFPGTVFGVEVIRKNDLPPLIIKCPLKSLLIKKRVRIIKGDQVRVEINPEEMGSSDTLKGTIVERKFIPRTN